MYKCTFKRLILWKAFSVESLHQLAAHKRQPYETKNTSGIGLCSLFWRFGICCARSLELQLRPSGLGVRFWLGR